MKLKRKLVTQNRLHIHPAGHQGINRPLKFLMETERPGQLQFFRQDPIEGCSRVARRQHADLNDAAAGSDPGDAPRALAWQRSPL